MNTVQNTQVINQYQQTMSVSQIPPSIEKQMQAENQSSPDVYSTMMQPTVNQFVPQTTYHSSVISKNAKSHKNASPTHVKLNQSHLHTNIYNKPVNNMYTNYTEQNLQQTNAMCLNERIQSEYRRYMFSVDNGRLNDGKN